MFKNIKNLSEYSLLNEKLVYEVPSATGEGLPPSKEVLELESRAKLREEMDALVFQHEGKILRLLVEGADYKNGDWRKMNEKFIEEFAKEGVEKEAAERLLKRFQKEAFESLGLRNDPLAVADGKLGSYTLYALALYFNLRRPKVAVPAGSRQLEALIDKDAKKAFEFYKKFPFAEKANIAEFKKVYRDIKANTSVFNPDSQYAKLGNWALALWESGFSDDEARNIGFPKLFAVDKVKYPYASEMKIRMVFDGKEDNPIFVNNDGELFEVNPYNDVLVPYEYKLEDEGGVPIEAPTEKIVDDDNPYAESDEEEATPEVPVAPTTPPPAVEPAPAPAPAEAPAPEQEAPAPEEPQPIATPTPVAPAPSEPAPAAAADVEPASPTQTPPLPRRVGLGDAPVVEGPTPNPEVQNPDKPRDVGEEEAEKVLSTGLNNIESETNKKLDKQDRWLAFSSKEALVSYLNKERPGQDWATRFSRLNASDSMRAAKTDVVSNTSGSTFNLGQAVAFFENGKTTYYLVKKTARNGRAK